MAHDQDKTDKVVPLPFPEPSEEDDISVEEWHQRQRLPTARLETQAELEYATPGVFRRFALWLLGRG